MQIAIEHDGGSTGAITQAVYRLEREAPVAARVAKVQLQATLDVLRELLAVHGAAGLGLTQLQDVTARGAIAKVMVEGDDTMYLGARKIECVGDQGHCSGWHMTDRVLNCMQHLQERPWLMLILQERALDGVTCHGIERARRVRRVLTGGWHRQSLLAAAAFAHPDRGAAEHRVLVGLRAAA
jgi:hypothetical protein